MADVARKYTYKKLSAVERWAENTAKTRYSKVLDAAIAVVILVLTLLLIAILVATYVAENREMVFNASSACTPALPINITSRAENRTYKRVTQLLQDSCENDSVVVAHQVTVGGVPYAYQLAHLCTLGITISNPIDVRYGEYTGKCEETVGNDTMVKVRHFPMQVNHTNGKIIKVHSLGKACQLQHALERLECTWH